MIRYPGSKDKVAGAILRRFPVNTTLPVFGQPIEYREPFFGGGALGFRLLRSLHPESAIWLNDKDYGLACLWQSVYHDPAALVDQIRGFQPSVDAFYTFKASDGDRGGDPVLVGFKKLAMHMTSFSGLGAMAGGPIGGRAQTSEYNVHCRWNADRLCKDVWERHALLRRFPAVQITSRDFAALVTNAPPSAFIYADPPYVAKGPELYKHDMREADHRRLAAELQTCRADWVLSYDDHPLIRDLYRWAVIESIDLTYTLAVAQGPRRKNSEVVVYPRAS